MELIEQQIYAQSLTMEKFYHNTDKAEIFTALVPLKYFVGNAFQRALNSRFIH